MEVSIMSLIIRKKQFKSNALAATLTAIATTSILGTLTYQFFGWSSSPVLALGIVAISCFAAYFFVEKTSDENAPQKQFILFNAALFFLTLACFWYATNHTATLWIGSPWQVLSPKYIAGLFFVIAATTYGIISEKISMRVLFFNLLLLFSVNTIAFKNGFGFDIFVHEATIGAWISQGTVTPLSILYNGYHALAASATAITRLPLREILAWITPFFGAIIISATVARLQTSEKKSTIPFFLLGFFLAFNSLFTSSTPQSLGHFLLIGFITELWLSEKNNPKQWIQRAIIALGIAFIHPLSGIPALAIFAWMFAHKFKMILAPLIIAAPAAALFFGANGSINFSNISLATFFNSNISAFQPFILTRLAYSATMFAPLIFIVGAFFGTAKKNSTEQNLFSAALLIFLSALVARTISIENIINYEQTAFAERLILAAFLCALPRAAVGFEALFTTIRSRAAQLTVAAIALACITSVWYVAHPAWNTVSRTKAINTSETDFAIVQTIDKRANNQPYIVLADQPTSAAALATFGFLSRPLPSRDFYFYPIPTGDKLYTNFFLPAMYDGITTKILRDAADFAHVKTVFIVVKPYWTNAEKNSTALKNSDLEFFAVGDTLVGKFSLK